ncbi:MAG: polyribonucleotide nucleotidyltransferase, partial [Aggregatilineales bacterium]
ENIEDEISVGDELMVMVTSIDPTGKVRLSRQAVLEGWTLEEARERDRGGRSSSADRGERDRGGRGSSADRGGRPSSGSSGRGGSHSGGRR